MLTKLKLIAIALLAVTTAPAQNKSLQVGLKLLGDVNTEAGFLSLGAGGQVVYRLTKHSGLESGLLYSAQRKIPYTVRSGGVAYKADIVEDWLVLPLLYRFDSRVVNVVAGPQVDYFLGWRNKHSEPSVIVSSYSRPNARLGLSGGISKTINLTPNWLLEPEGKLVYYPREHQGNFGINIALRRKLY